MTLSGPYGVGCILCRDSSTEEVSNAVAEALVASLTHFHRCMRGPWVRTTRNGKLYLACSGVNKVAIVRLGSK